MPHVYMNADNTAMARRGRRAMMGHPDWRGSSSDRDWRMLANDMIADILHGLNSRVDLRAGEVESILGGALRTYNADFSMELQ